MCTPGGPQPSARADTDPCPSLRCRVQGRRLDQGAVARAIVAVDADPLSLWTMHAQAFAMSARFNPGATHEAHCPTGAGALDREFWTADTHLARAVKHESARVRLLPE